MKFRLPGHQVLLDGLLEAVWKITVLNNQPTVSQDREMPVYGIFYTSDSLQGMYAVL